MKSISISNLNLLAIEDKKTNEIFYGCDQEWFATAWQRMAGCGATVAADIVLYLNGKCGVKKPRGLDKDECLLLMNEIWNYVTPTGHGVNTTKLFYEPLYAYIKSKGLKYQYRHMDLPAAVGRPKLPEALGFLTEALSKDVPAAFLNLNNGKEKNLDEWHWVTVVSLETDENEEQAFVQILDEGIVKKIDFALWYQTTTRDGGLVYFTE